MCNAYSVNCNITWNQAFDLDPQGSYVNISQLISINTTGPYLLHLEWMPPFYMPVFKVFTIEINSSTLADVKVLSDICSTNIEEYLLNLSPGPLNFTIRMTATSPDMSGIVVSNFKLQELIPIPPSPAVAPVSPLTNNTTDNIALTTTDSVF